MSEEINRLKTEVAVINNKLDNINDKVSDVIEMLKSHMEEEDKNRRELMATKADKQEVEDLKSNQVWIVRLIIGIVVTAVVGLVIKSF